MTVASRLAHIFRSLNAGQPVTAKLLEQQLEVSRATIFRDLDVLRDQLGVPIVWDADTETFRIEPPQDGRPPQFMVPGLWMDAHELYGLLTVINLAKLIDPGFVAPWYVDYRVLLKQMMERHRIYGYQIDRKIAVELPQLQGGSNPALDVIGPALILNLKIKLQVKPGSAIKDGTVLQPKRLVLREAGWMLEYSVDADGLISSLSLQDIVDAEPVDWASYRRDMV